MPDPLPLRLSACQRLSHFLVTLILGLGISLAEGHAVTLTWNPSPSNNVAGYRIHYGFIPGGYAHALTFGVVTNVTFDLPIQGETYYFTATAYDAAGLESGYSNEVLYHYPVESGGTLPLPVLGSVQTLEEQPVALPWGPADGYAADAVWLTAFPPQAGRLIDQEGHPVYAPRLNATGLDTCVYFIIEAPESEKPVSYKVLVQIDILPVNDRPVALD
ncbi:MAG: fibronectin type III domain-containing protein, partial [Verrucomicrobiae bacterium]|nr:fibronectin type III domain-containing protein [Verrucomicrobiae bacterium]